MTPGSLRQIRAVFLAAIVGATPNAAFALPKQNNKISCGCTCEAPSGVNPAGKIYSFDTYTIPGTSCSPIVGKTCNVTNVFTGGVATGSILGCGAGTPAVQGPPSTSPCIFCSGPLQANPGRR
jgi:hypothetical protein